MTVTDLSAHPYFPLDLHLPGYVPLTVGFDYILGVFAAAVVTVFGATWVVSGEALGAAAWLAAASAAGCCWRGRAGVCTHGMAVHNRAAPQPPPNRHATASLTHPSLHPSAGRRKHLGTKERMLACWFMVTGETTELASRGSMVAAGTAAAAADSTLAPTHAARPHAPPQASSTL